MLTIDQFEKIALWMGWEKVVKPPYREVWYIKNENYDYVQATGKLGSIEVIEVLYKMNEKGYMYELFNGSATDIIYAGCDITTKQRWIEFKFDKISDDPDYIRGRGFSINEAVERALLNLIKKELI